MTRLIEIRTYRLKPDTNDRFHEAMRDRAVPFIRSKGMDVVAFGASDHEEQTYFLVRAYADRSALETEQSEFYGSTKWRDGPRRELIEHIDSYVNTLITLSDDAIESIRNSNKHLQA